MPSDIERIDGDASGTRPIFILGILPRCGTNFLSDLLCLHPDCAPPAPIWEDFFVAHANLLDRYVDGVVGSWDQGSQMHWEPVEKGAGFDPIQRFGQWSAAQHERFNWVAGRQLQRLGYTTDREPSSGVLWTAWNLALDVKWLAIRLFGPMVLKLRRR